MVKVTEKKEPELMNEDETNKVIRCGTPMAIK